MIKDRRIGKFMVTIDLIEKSIESVAETLKLLEFVPLRVECLGWGGSYEYIGISPLFDEIDEGSLPTLYMIECDFIKKTVSAKRV